MGKVSACNTRDPGDAGLTPVSGRSPGEGFGKPLQYSCLENPMESGSWWATVLSVAESGVIEMIEHAGTRASSVYRSE